jgi:hypothetical protein
MKKIFTIIVLFFCVYAAFSQSQNLNGIYQKTGYFFHPSSSRALNTSTQITKITGNTYELSLGDLGGFSYRFTVDASNNLTNWVAVGSTPAAPSSGFMTLDNPGGFANYPLSTSGFIHSTYNNRYDPVTKTFYLHYGYTTGSTSQNQYNRQIYEKYVFLSKPVDIISFSPSSGTAGTIVTVLGQGFTSLDYSSVTIGINRSICDSLIIVSDSVINVIVGSGSTGKIYVSNAFGSDSLGNFNYTAPVVNNTDWQYIGGAGFTNSTSLDINMDISTTNIPYVVFKDSSNGKVFVKNFIGSNWLNVGGAVSDSTKAGACGAKISFGNTNNPYVCFQDLNIANRVTVKKFDGTNWVVVGLPGFAPSSNATNLDIVVDGNDVPFIICDSVSNIRVYRYNGTAWVNLNVNKIGYEYGIAVNKINSQAYVVYGDYTNANVTSYNGATWANVGNANFALGNVGIFYLNIIVDKTGIPIVSMQDDNGYERISSYKLISNIWTILGEQNFSKSRSYYLTQAITKNNFSVVAFTSGSFNGQGNVMGINSSNNWGFLGARGFLPTYNGFQKHALVVDTNNYPMIAFSDKNNSRKVSVMKMLMPIQPYRLAITSFLPTSGTSGTVITVKGQGFTSLEQYGVSMGLNHTSCDSLIIVSDSVIKIIVGNGSSGKIYLSSIYGADSLGSFTYIPPIVNNTEWQYIGGAGFTNSTSLDINMDVSFSNNIPYVVYKDSSNGKVFVKHFISNSWVSVGAAVSDSTKLGVCGAKISFGTSNNPYVCYQDLNVNNRVTVKKFNGTNWIAIGLPGFAPISNTVNLDIVIDGNDVPYIICDSQSNIRVYRYNGTAWINLNVNKTGYEYGFAVNKITNQVFVTTTDFTNIDVVNYNGSSWTPVGNSNFSLGSVGVFYLNIVVDKTGIPIVSMQDDDGFERITFFKLVSNVWTVLGAKNFSKSRSYYLAPAITKNNFPLIAFSSGSFNGQGNIMGINSSNSWGFIGVRGFVPTYYGFQKHALVVDTNNVPMIAFSDKNNGRKVSVMRLGQPIPTNSIRICANGVTSIVSELIGSTYQWQVDSGVGFTNIVNNANYSGTQLKTLQIINIPTSWYGYTYRCVVNGDYGPSNTINFTQDWTGYVSNNWENAGNWSCGVIPDSNTDVVFDSGDVILINSNVTIRSLKVSPSSSINVQTGNTLTIRN